MIALSMQGALFMPECPKYGTPSRCQAINQFLMDKPPDGIAEKHLIFPLINRFLAINIFQILKKTGSGEFTRPAVS